MAIDIANPGDKGDELRDALLSLVGAQPLEVEYEGEFNINLVTFGVAPGVMSFFPADVQVTAPGCWLQDLSCNGEDGLTSLAFPNLAGVINGASVEGWSGLTDLDFPELAVVGEDFEFSGNEDLVDIGVPKLRAVGGEIEFGNCDALTSFEAPLLEYCRTFDIYNNPVLADFDVPELATADDIWFYAVDGLTELTFPALTTLRDEFGIAGCNDLESVSFPAIERFGYVSSWNGLPSLENWSWGAGLKSVAGSFDLDDAILSQESVDHILTKLAGLDGENGTTLYENQSIYLASGNAIPSPAGWAAVFVLRADRSCYVDVNGPSELAFSMTAGTSGGVVGYESGSYGSVTPFEYSPWLVGIRNNEGSFGLAFNQDGNTNIFNTVNGKSLWVDEVEYPGSWSSDEMVSYTLTSPESPPTFVNGNTYSIEIK